MRITSRLFPFLVAVLVCAFSASLLHAIDYYVDGQHGDDTRSGLSADDAWKTITHALEAVVATEGDPAIINIAAGTYSASTNGEAFPLALDGYTRLAGISPETTIIDAESDDVSVITLQNSWGVSIEQLSLMRGSSGAVRCVDSELSILGCFFLDNTGSGLYASGSVVTARDSRFSGNHGAFAIYLWQSDASILGCGICDNRGTAVYCGDSSLRISDCLIQDNTSTDDCPGVICSGSDVRIEDTRIAANVCTSNRYTLASALLCWYSSCSLSRCLIECNESRGPIFEITARSPVLDHTLYIEDSLIQGNISDCRAAIYCDNSASSPSVSSRGRASMYAPEFTLLIRGCTVEGNSMSDRYIGQHYLIYHEAYEYPLGGGVIDSVIWRNDGRLLSWVHTSYHQSLFPIEHCCVQEPTESHGNFQADPMFVSGPLGDYYLSSVEAGQEADSPCIDAGSRSASIAGVGSLTTRTDGEFDAGVVDIGYHYSATPPTIECDVSDGSDALTGVLDEQSFTPGDTLSASISMENGGLRLWVDVYAGFILPDGSIYCITPDGLTTDITPWEATILLPTHLASCDIAVFHGLVPGGLPVGTYKFAAALCLTDEFRPIGDLAFAQFTIGI